MLIEFDHAWVCCKCGFGPNSGPKCKGPKEEMEEMKGKKGKKEKKCGEIICGKCTRHKSAAGCIKQESVTGCIKQEPVTRYIKQEPETT